MQIEQHCWSASDGWCAPGGGPGPADLVLAFGARHALEGGAALEALRARYPGASLVGCSTAGEICGTRVVDDTVTSTAVTFERASVLCRSLALADSATSGQAGRKLGALLDPDGLRHVVVLSEGLRVNGSELVRGLAQGLPPEVGVTGGLSADGDRFERTLVFCDGPAREGHVVAVGLYGEALRVGCGSLGGWDPFGPERLVTRSEGNVLYELDGQPALDLYRLYLGEHAVRLRTAGSSSPSPCARERGSPAWCARSWRRTARGGASPSPATCRRGAW